MQKIHSRLAPVASRLQISLPDFVGISETGRSISRLAGFGLMRNDALPTTAEESSGNDITRPEICPERRKESRSVDCRMCGAGRV